MAIRGGGNPFQRIGEYRFSITDVKLEIGLIKSVERLSPTVLPKGNGPKLTRISPTDENVQLSRPVLRND